MVAAKSLIAGILGVASLASYASPARAGSIVAGAKGTLYIGGNGNGGGDGNGSLGIVNQTNPFVSGTITNLDQNTPPTPTPPPAAAPQAGSSVPSGGYQGVMNFTPSAAYTPAPTTSYDAFINFGTAPYADQAFLTAGSAQSWADSPAVAKAFGHTPTAQEQNDFSQTVLARVESTFAKSGLTISATTDPHANADHMMSVVSGLSSPLSPEAIGITKVGHNGFDFIDKLAYANSPDELMWAVAHNVAHELMHAFGGEHHLTPEGNNLDAPSSDWSILLNEDTKFSAASVAEMTYNLRQGGLAARYGVGAEELTPVVDGQELASHPVPEPATLALWASMAGLAGLIRTRSRRAA